MQRKHLLLICAGSALVFILIIGLGTVGWFAWRNANRNAYLRQYDCDHEWADMDYTMDENIPDTGPEQVFTTESSNPAHNDDYDDEDPEYYEEPEPEPEPLPEPIEIATFASLRNNFSRLGSNGLELPVVGATGWAGARIYLFAEPRLPPEPEPEPEPEPDEYDDSQYDEDEPEDNHTEIFAGNFSTGTHIGVAGGAFIGAVNMFYSEEYPAYPYAPNEYDVVDYPHGEYPGDVHSEQQDNAHAIDAYPADTYADDAYGTDAYTADTHDGYTDTLDDTPDINGYPHVGYPDDEFNHDIYTPLDIYPFEEYPTDVFPYTYPYDGYPYDMPPIDGYPYVNYHYSCDYEGCVCYECLCYYSDELPCYECRCYGCPHCECGYNECTCCDCYVPVEIIQALVPGQPFVILEVYGIWWYIQLPNRVTGWVLHSGCFINLPDVIPSLVFNITNAYYSVLRSSGYDIPNVSGEALYSARAFNHRLGRYEFIVPALYATSYRIFAAQQAALANGDTIIIYEVFRPSTTQMRVVSNLTTLMNENETVHAALNTPPWSPNWFISHGTSHHQRGAAVDASIGRVTSYEIRHMDGFAYRHILDYVPHVMPTPMHELNPTAAIFISPGNSTPPETMTEGATIMQGYFRRAGFSLLASEWWHFNDNAGIGIAQRHNMRGVFFTETIYSVPPSTLAGRPRN